MKKVYIVAAKRTAIGSFLGSLKNESASDLGAVVLKNIIEETKINPEKIDEVIIGNVLHAGQGQGVGRQVAIKAGIPFTVPGYSVNMVCGSGMKALMTGYANIKADIHKLVVAGGVESMSQAPYLAHGNLRNGHKMGDFKLTDHMVFDALTDVYEGCHMGITAENIRRKYNITREEQDEFAAESQKRAIEAIKLGKFKDEIVPYEVKTKKGSFIFDTDEHPREGTTVEVLARLKPAFEENGTVTAGNSSGINDGAAMIMLASEEIVREENLNPMAEVIAVGQGGVDPSIMGLGPTPAIRNALKMAKLKLSDIDLLELNEAFAAQALGVIRELSNEHCVSEAWLRERTNVNGGAIALGHPVGVSGARIIVTLVHEMKKRGSKLGIASLCIGGGMGTAVVIKNLG
ncbi:acetyl-CoA C-acetyltransferase [Biomaibacter acetigenes]|uniref:Acetyl-CoA acetyltransferase n=1 Tax=Biomaibacter acetigenes TaxID=2316383 RepID=A0A3G2R1U1_9FIRM|nr:acetyl-CoA C-acetyltransferase [Biomaibacter acetigenes]AYO29400.1 acetyl-CoA C-acetyltransferase [Biomaibacter acetigenes]